MIPKSTDIAIVVAQLASVSEIFLLGDFEAMIMRPALMIIMGLGLALTIASAVNLGQSYSSSTAPKETNALQQKGIYRLIRHPIYTGLFVVSFAFLLSRPTIQVGVAYLLVVLISNVRADLEEAALIQLHPEYAAYRQHVKRYVPFII